MSKFSSLHNSTIFTHEEDLSAFKTLSLCMYVCMLYIGIQESSVTHDLLRAKVDKLMQFFCVFSCTLWKAIFFLKKIGGPESSFEAVGCTPVYSGLGL